MAKKELLFSVTKKDLVIEFFSGHGPGGQNRNKCQNCCRIKHSESGAVATGQEERSREQNLRNAFRRLAETPKFKLWVQKKVWEIDHKQTVEQYVDKMMEEKNLKVEILEDGQWVPYSTKE
jgi:protein subunit release factor B